MSISSLTEDLLEEVFARLPVQSLLQFRCVSKSWRDLIDSREFIKAHLNLTHKGPQAVQEFIWKIQCFDKSKGENPCTKFYVSEFDSFEKLMSTVVEVKHPFQMHQISDPFIIGCSNGLVCLKGLTDLVLWNPSIRKHWILPAPPHQLPQLGLYYCERFYYGFGYDDSTDDYKVVRLVQIYQNNSPVDQEVKIYSLRSNSWRHLPRLPRAGSIFWPVHGVLVNYALHWTMVGTRQQKYDSYSDVILALNLRTEDYSFVPQPEISEVKYNWCLEALDGCLCMFLVRTSTLVDIWVMRDYGVKDSWTKLNLSHSDASPRWTRKGCNPITGSNRNKQLFSQAMLPTAHHVYCPENGYRFAGSLVRPEPYAGRVEGGN